MATIDAEGNLHDTSGRFAPQSARRPAAGLALDDGLTPLDAARARYWQTAAETDNARWRQAEAQMALLSMQVLSHAPAARQAALLWKRGSLHLHDLRDADGASIAPTIPLSDIQGISGGPIGWSFGDPRYRNAVRQDSAGAGLFWLDITP